MPRVEFKTENKVKSGFDFPRISLDKGETARIIAIETGPTQGPEVEYVHTMRMPRLVNGEVVTEPVKKKDGGYTNQPLMDFVGRHICLGSYDVLCEKGVDPVGCPVCAASKESSAVLPPVRRFAMNVIQYATKPGGFEIANPFNVQVKAWSFADKVFNDLTDAAEEWGSLLEHDLRLGPCEVKQFQKFDITVARDAEWLKDDPEGTDRKARVKDTYKNNKCPDLSSLIGRRLTPDQVADDLDRVVTRYKLAYGPKDQASGEEISSETDLSDLLGEDSTPSNGTEPKAAAVNEAEAKTLDELLDGL